MGCVWRVKKWSVSDTFGIGLTAEVGANDGLVAVRVVPDGRDGENVHGRDLKAGEPDQNVPIAVAIAGGLRIASTASFVFPFRQPSEEGHQ
jgi:hypothetical protein